MGMKPGDLVTTRRFVALVDSELFRGSVGYGVANKKTQSLAFIYLGVHTEGQPLDVDAILNRLGWQFPEARTEVPPEVIEERRRAFFAGEVGR